jgi:predicted flap endonuclease-1-like 5' DNA nuclease
MAEPTANLRCTLACWGCGLLIGAFAIMMLLVIGGWYWTGAFVLGGVIFVGSGLFMSILFCRPLPTLADVQARHAAAGTTIAAGRALPNAGDGGAPLAARTALDDEQVLAQSAAPTSSRQRPAHASGDTPGHAADPAPDPAEQSAPVSRSDSGDVTEPAAAPALASGGAGATGSVSVLPESTGAPSAAGSDDLTLMKGVGPKLAGLLNDMGIHRFEQMAEWSPAEAKRLDDSLSGFKGRIAREKLVEQAKVIVASRTGRAAGMTGEKDDGRR